MAKKFLYVCAGLFLLVLSYHLGAGTAGAQSAGSILGIAGAGGDGSKHWAVLRSSDSRRASVLGPGEVRLPEVRPPA